MIYFRLALFKVVNMLVVFTTLIIFSISVQSRDFKMPYTAKGIATLGASGVEQGKHGDCWFEASLAEIARLPHGQQKIANMITYADDHSYIVHFPDNASVYKITLADIKAWGLCNRALWASIIECAMLKRFHENTGNASNNEIGAMGSGLQSLTGNQIERKVLNTMSEDELSSFIYEAVHSENPILITTQINVPLPLVSNHVYSITDIDLTHKIVVLRNPWGVNPGVAREPKSKNNGELKLSLEQLQKYFTVVTRSWL